MVLTPCHMLYYLIDCRDKLGPMTQLIHVDPNKNQGLDPIDPISADPRPASKAVKIGAATNFYWKILDGDFHKCGVPSGKLT